MSIHVTKQSIENHVRLIHREFPAVSRQVADLFADKLWDMFQSEIQIDRTNTGAASMIAPHISPFLIGVQMINERRENSIPLQVLRSLYTDVRACFQRITDMKSKGSMSLKDELFHAEKCIKGMESEVNAAQKHLPKEKPKGDDSSMNVVPNPLRR